MPAVPPEVTPLLRLVERIVARGGPSAAAAALRRGSRIVLAYHNIVPDGEAPAGERTLHLPLERFREQLDALQRSHDVVSLPELLEPSRKHRRPVAAITFDDAYRGCLTLALPELERRGLPSTVFVTPGLLGSAGCWWDQLASPRTGSQDPREREHLLTALKGDAGAVLDHARSRGVEPTPCPPTHRIATEGELLHASRLQGVRFGAHSWTHRNLAALDEEELAEELAPPLEWLRARIPDVLPWLAFPYGLHSPAVIAQARRSGYEGVLRISGAGSPRRMSPPATSPASTSRPRSPATASC
jgi:peptidoglycan/xylan/chitin deacetylase (PgdA/CDA1 family)